MNMYYTYRVAQSLKKEKVYGTHLTKYLAIMRTGTE